MAPNREHVQSTSGELTTECEIMGETERNAPVWISFRGRSKPHEGVQRDREDRDEARPSAQSQTQSQLTSPTEFGNVIQPRQPPEGGGPFRTANLPE